MDTRYNLSNHNEGSIIMTQGRIIMTFKCMKRMAPTYISLQFVSGGSTSGRSTRQSSH
jgi:hypothetical protein